MNFILRSLILSHVYCVYAFYGTERALYPSTNNVRCNETFRKVHRYAGDHESL